MHVAVLGAGVVGAATAYSLVARGHAVTIVDRASAPAAGSTHANGGQLSYSFTDSLAKPSFLAYLPRLLLNRDPGARVRLSADPPLLAWGLAFLSQCTPSRSRANTIALLQTAMRSAPLLEQIEQRAGIGFAHRRNGKLVLLPAKANLSVARDRQALKRQHGCETELLGMDEAREREPALHEYRGRFAAAVYSAQDEVGDARDFTLGLIDWLVKQRGATVRLGSAVNSLLIDRGRVCGVRCGQDELVADAVVVCLGARSTSLLESAGVPARIYPVRGYSVTLPRGRAAPAMSITDLARRLLISPLHDRVRISGFADFVGFDGSHDDDRISDLVEQARLAAPDAADYTVTEQHRWAGSRPMTPDGRPLVGASGVPGLYLNCGHGMLGWTLACATGESAADAVVPTACGARS